MVEREAVAPLHTRIFRGIASERFKPGSLNIEATENPETIAKLHELIGRNYGIVEITNHWGLMEIPAVIKWNYQNPDLKKSKIIVPYGSHQFRRLHSLEGTFLSTRLMRTRTPDSDEYYTQYPEQKPSDYLQLNPTYISESANLLRHGGTVIFSPQGGRQSSLPERIRNGMLAPFLIGLQSEGFDLNRSAFLTIGTGLRGVEDYERWIDTKFSEPHPQITLNINSIHTFEETGLDGRLLRSDAWAREQLSHAVPENYLVKRS